MDPSFGQYLSMEHQRKLARAEARERLSVEEQAVRGLLDEHPVLLGRRRSHIRLRKAWAWAFVYVWGPA